MGEREGFLENMTLLLLYLTSWEEKVVRNLRVRGAWKGYPFEISG